MIKNLALTLIIGFSFEATLLAQPGPLGKAIEEATGGSPNRRNDLEGGIWEYKVIKRSGDKETVLVGKIRIKESAAFDVSGSASGSLLKDRSKNENEENDAPVPFLKKKTSGPKRLGVMDRIAEGNRGGERIGDINYERSSNSTSTTPKVSFKFDLDDDHILSGDANVKYDTRGGGGVWRGVYYERHDKDKTKWTFELRAIED